jgi:hypothetical protein
MNKALDILRRLASGDNRGDFFISNELLKEVEEILAQSEQDLREGITLRDHFAGLAMQGLVVSRPTWEDTRRIALTSYEQADAMLAERGKRDD